MFLSPTGWSEPPEYRDEAIRSADYADYTDAAKAATKLVRLVGLAMTPDMPVTV